MSQLSLAMLRRINLGCGTTKYAGWINIDIEPSVQPDIVCDFRHTGLPFDGESMDMVLMSHVIEHIEKPLWEQIFAELWRVLVPGGKLRLMYPEFREIAQRWLDNKQGQREFWEATIYGRQLYPGDYHVSAVDSRDLVLMLSESGWKLVQHGTEPAPNEFNSFLEMEKVAKPLTREDIMRQEYGFNEAGPKGSGTV